jgi:hypothetical protein
VARHSVWELIFLMVILKIPIVYLGLVVYHAIKAEPRPEEGAAVTARLRSDGPGPVPRLRRHRFRLRPHGGPARTYARRPATATATATARAEAVRR